ncbi:MAG TPA: zinc-binding alcohol dehydrogenase family protein [Polyangia bacterium]|nr:zinc-binding alcohol dehydrogenase family protein [Polyangia bacterium]
MRAAVIHGRDQTPDIEEFPEPDLAPGEQVARVLAAGLHPLVRSHAQGGHYSSTDRYPLIPGVDAVVEMTDGRRLYTGWMRHPYGTFAERAAVAGGIELPQVAVPEQVAAMVNPASSSWLALRLRAALQPKEHVVILGATGAAGRLAVQIARALGAGRVVAVGRNAEVLAELRADRTLLLDEGYRPSLVSELKQEGVDVVLDYLWGSPAIETFEAIAQARGERRLRYVGVGQMAGVTVPFSPHALRATDTVLLGSGLGAVTQAQLGQELPQLIGRIVRGELTLPFRVVPLAEVPGVWRDSGARRVVIAPTAR